MEKFVCSHCGHHFESEPKETLICPNCSWSTSVVKESSEVSPKKVAPEKVNIPTTEKPSSEIWFRVGGVLFILVLIGVSFFAIQHLKKQDAILQKIKSKNAKVIASEAPELALSPADQEILSRKVAVEPTQALGDLEKEVLTRRILFRSRLAKGLPTPPWSEAEFEAFLKGEEARYGLPLEWSYRRKLKNLFKEHALVAAGAFDTKDYLKARDEWIRALAFPVYYNDIQKHRGVILTMLRPYINDTLSKIGMINALLTEGDAYSKEGKIRADYEALFGLLENQAWEEAGAKILELTKELEEIQTLPQSVTPPPLPNEISQIDEGIRQVLLTQVSPSQPSAPDWESLKQDLNVKERMIQSRLPGALELIQREYGEALSFIESKNWAEARRLLEKIDFPENLANDAQEKVRILDKLTKKNGEG